MKLLSPAIFILFSLLFSNLTDCYSQQKQVAVIKQDFIPLLDSLIAPPPDCRQAFDLMILDSIKNVFYYSAKLNDQNIRIQNLYDEIYKSVKENNANRFVIPQRPQINGPPQSGFPQDNFGDLRSEYELLKFDMDEANVSVDKLNIEREQFKDDLKLLEKKVNDEIHKTLESDHEAHQIIVNKFLKAASDLYLKNLRDFRKYMVKIDGVLKKFQYGEFIKSPVIRSDLTELQFAQITNLKFLLNITDELANIGAKFYR